jgi:hypothetical protein
VEFLQKFQVLIAITFSVTVSTAVTLIVFRLTKRRERQAEEKSLVVLWRSVLLELESALERMRNAALTLSKGEQGELTFPNSEIYVSVGLEADFLRRCESIAAARLVLSIYDNLHQFSWNMREVQHQRRQLENPVRTQSVTTSKKPIEGYVRSALWFAVFRHWRMVDALQECDQLYRDYCEGKKHVDPGSDLGAIQKLPERMQEDENKAAKTSDKPE